MIMSGPVFKRPVDTVVIHTFIHPWHVLMGLSSI